jgi:Predicted SAM-dependent methyltransferases
MAVAWATMKPGHERRLRAGHLWIYQGNVDEVDGEAAPGDVVDVRSAAGDFLGRGYYNPRSQIAIRLLAREPEKIDYAFFVERIRRARPGGSAGCPRRRLFGWSIPRAICCRV